MGVVANLSKDLTTLYKDLTLFFVAYTIIVFIIGQYFSLLIPRHSNLWWYPVYLLIIVLIIKVIADAFTGGAPPAKKK